MSMFILRTLIDLQFLTSTSSESPYPEVRASVSSVDDPLMPVNTFRVYVPLLSPQPALTLDLSDGFWVYFSLL